jgi:hypothetical protein
VALHNIWGMTDPTTMAVLSLVALSASTLLALVGAIKLFAKGGTS